MHREVCFRSELTTSLELMFSHKILFPDSRFQRRPGLCSGTNCCQLPVTDLQLWCGFCLSTEPSINGVTSKSNCEG